MGRKEDCYICKLRAEIKKERKGRQNEQKEELSQELWELEKAIMKKRMELRMLQLQKQELLKEKE